ncbi:DUF1634 domain-containing protein [Ktedonospora formicarum]|uniref:Membrane protein n=1 Tax=Ktedonospora formicarum TaxID=2778364 RepID=A0A8J3HWK0_9CHLR|nr:DUF1634 domain-containing protein [Ktedonospora formicarum]GHO45089.1 membrane protein [Ktedonospora formicarum]
MQSHHSSSPENVSDTNNTHHEIAFTPSMPPARINDLISRVLQVGVIASSTVIIIGLLLFLFQPDALKGQHLEDFPHTLDQFTSAIVHLQPLAIIMLGLIILIATPILRVVFSILAFYLEHDYRYVIITCIVLALLIFGMLLGKGGA